jgi:hypothetical protein
MPFGVLAVVYRATAAGGTKDTPVHDTTVARTAAELAALGEMTGAEMAEKYVLLFGQSARSRNKVFLRKRLAWRIQELAEGGLSERALARIEELGPAALASWCQCARAGAPPPPRASVSPRSRDPRLPTVGTVLTRSHGEIEHRVKSVGGDEDPHLQLCLARIP